MSNRPLDRVRRALDPTFRTNRHEGEADTQSQDVVIQGSDSPMADVSLATISEAPSSQVNTGMIIGGTVNELDGPAPVITRLASSHSNQTSAFSGFSNEPRDLNLTGIRITPQALTGPAMVSQNTSGDSRILGLSGPTPQRFNRGSDIRPETRVEVGTQALVSTF